MKLFIGLLLLLLSDIIVWFQFNAKVVFEFDRNLLWWFFVTGWLVFLCGTYGWWLTLESQGIWKTVVIYSILTLFVDIVLNSIFCGWETKYIISLFLCFIAGLISH